MRRARLLLAVLTALSPLSRSAAAQADTIGSRRGLFTYRDLVLAGSVVAVTLLARPFDDHYAARLQDSATHTLKGIVGRQRPYVRPRNPNSYRLFRGFGGGDAFRSLPSGHTTAAFAAAAAVTSETSRW